MITRYFPLYLEFYTALHQLYPKIIISKYFCSFIFKLEVSFQTAVKVALDAMITRLKIKLIDTIIVTNKFS